jgi:hypothetical protein
MPGLVFRQGFANSCLGWFWTAIFLFHILSRWGLQICTTIPINFIFFVFFFSAEDLGRYSLLSYIISSKFMKFLKKKYFWTYFYLWSSDVFDKIFNFKLFCGGGGCCCLLIQGFIRPVWTQTQDPLALASLSTSVTDMPHHAWLYTCYFCRKNLSLHLWFSQFIKIIIYCWSYNTHR